MTGQMNNEQRERWKTSGLFPLELWGTGEGSTPLVCPTPDCAELRRLASSVPEHIQASGWYLADKPAFGHNYLYAENFRGMGRQWIADFPAGKRYFGEVAQYIAALHPRTLLRLLDRLDELEKKSATPQQRPDNDGAQQDFCHWTFDDNEFAPVWNGSCGAAWSFIDGGPEENKLRYCPECGKRCMAAKPHHDNDGTPLPERAEG